MCLAFRSRSNLCRLSWWQTLFVARLNVRTIVVSEARRFMRIITRFPVALYCVLCRRSIPILHFLWQPSGFGITMHTYDGADAHIHTYIAHPSQAHYIASHVPVTQRSTTNHGLHVAPTTHPSCLARGPQLAALADILESCKEFGFDLEGHNARTYHGLTCLMQISTETKVQ